MTQVQLWQDKLKALLYKKYSQPFSAGEQHPGVQHGGRDVEQVGLEAGQAARIPHLRRGPGHHVRQLLGQVRTEEGQSPSTLRIGFMVHNFMSILYATVMAISILTI